MHIHIPLYCSLFNHPSWCLLVIRIFRTNIASTRSQIELYCFEMLWSVLNIFKNLLYFIIPLLNHHGGISQQRPVGEWLVRLNFGTFQSLILTAELKVTPHRASTSNKICSTSQSRQWQVRGAEVARDSCDKIRFKDLRHECTRQFFGFPWTFQHFHEFLGYNPNLTGYMTYSISKGCTKKRTRAFKSLAWVIASNMAWPASNTAIFGGCNKWWTVKLWENEPDRSTCRTHQDQMLPTTPESEWNWLTRVNFAVMYTARANHDVWRCWRSPWETSVNACYGTMLQQNPIILREVSHLCWHQVFVLFVLRHDVKACRKIFKLVVELFLYCAHRNKLCLQSLYHECLNLAMIAHSASTNCHGCAAGHGVRQAPHALKVLNASQRRGDFSIRLND